MFSECSQKEQGRLHVHYAHHERYCVRARARTRSCAHPRPRVQESAYVPNANELVNC